MTSFHDDSKNLDSVLSFPSAAERAVVLAEAFEGLEHALLIFDVNHKLLSANAQAREILHLPGNGVRPDNLPAADENKNGAHRRALEELAEATGLAANDRFVWPSVRGVLDGYRNILANGGSVVSLIERSVPSKIPNHSLQDAAPNNFSPELLSLAQDLVTARDQARDASRKAEENQSRVEAIVESVVDAIITTDGSGSIHTFNPAAERIFGYVQEEIIGKTLGTLFLPHGLEADADLFSGDVVAKIQSVLGRSLDEVGLTKAGIIFPVRFVATEMNLDNQKMLNWVIRDVTEDRRTREALQQKSNLIQLLHSVAEAATEAESVAETIEVGVKAVCSHMGWPLGHAYDCCDDISIGSQWHVADEFDENEFRAMTNPALLSLHGDHSGGMINHLATNDSAAWFTEINSVMSGRKAATAHSCGLKSGLVLPILMDGEIVVVPEFFTTESITPEATTLQALTQVGRQLGRALERKKTDETIRHMALRDALTGLANREQFQQQMPVALANSLRTGRSVALLTLDIDNFKDVNDTLGHPVGDQLLVQVAERLAECSRETDTIVRLGGDEFAVIATNLVDEDGAARLANRIINSVSEPVTLDGHEVMVTCSVGVTIYPSDGLDSTQLQKKADLALYRQKRMAKIHSGSTTLK